VANCRVSTNVNSSSRNTTQDKSKKPRKKNEKRRKMDQVRPFMFKHECLKISVDLQNILVAEIYLAAGQWLEKQLNVVKSGIFLAGTRLPAVSKRDVQHFMPIDTCVDMTTPYIQRLHRHISNCHISA
jgi:hypothetical protein